MGLVTSLGVGGSEEAVALTDRSYVGGIRGVVASHAHDEVPVDAIAGSPASTMKTIAMRYPTLFPAMGGPRTWGNDAAMTRFVDAVLHATSPTGLGATGKVFVVGTSMGTVAACRAVVEHPEKVKALALIVPMADLVRQHDDNIIGLAPSIEAALGITGTYEGNPALAKYDPMQLAAAMRATGIPIKVWYASNDTWAPTAYQQELIERLGCDSFNGGPVGHTYAAAPFGDIEQWLFSQDRPGDTYRKQVLATPGLVAFWPLDDDGAGDTFLALVGPNATANASVADANRGVPSIVATEPAGKAYLFGQSARYVTAPMTAAQACAVGKVPFTVEMWVRPDSDGSTRYLAAYWDATTSTGWWIRRSTANQILFVRALNNVNRLATAAIPLVTSPTNRHIGVTFDGLRQRIVIDGGLQADTVTVPHDLGAGTEGAMHIGHLANTSSWVGAGQNLALYNRALSVDELKQRYYAGRVGS